MGRVSVSQPHRSELEQSESGLPATEAPRAGPSGPRSLVLLNAASKWWSSLSGGSRSAGSAVSLSGRGTGQRPSDGGASRVRPAATVHKLEPRERLAGYIGAGVAVVGAIAFFGPHIHERVAKNTLSPETSLVVGVVLGLALAASTAIGRRSLVGFSALLIGFAWTSFPFLGFPFLGLAGWLIIRATRFSRDDAEARRQAGGGSSAAGRGAKPARSGGLFGRKAPEPQAKAGPDPSKRYTPPAPERKRESRSRPAASSRAKKPASPRAKRSTSSS